MGTPGISGERGRTARGSGGSAGGREGCPNARPWLGFIERPSTEEFRAVTVLVGGEGWELRSAHGGCGDGGAARPRLDGQAGSRRQAWRRLLRPRPSTIRAPPWGPWLATPLQTWWPSHRRHHRPCPWRRITTTTITTTPAGLAPLSPPLALPSLWLRARAPARRPWMLSTTAARPPRRRRCRPPSLRRYVTVFPLARVVRPWSDPSPRPANLAGLIAVVQRLGDGRRDFGEAGCAS